MNDLCKNPIVLCLVSGLVASVLSFMDHRLNNEGEFVPDFTRYLKILILVSGLSYGVVTLSCNSCPVNLQAGGGELKNAPWNENLNEIHTGNPNF